VDKHGWEARVKLNMEDVAEVEWFRANGDTFNGRGIRNETGEEVIHRVGQRAEIAGGRTVIKTEVETEIEDEGLGWLVRESGLLIQIQEFPGGREGQQVGQAHEELEEIGTVLRTRTTAAVV
jgi:hypothetical protein